jgi:beta-N-acetylhexosaminidase
VEESVERRAFICGLAGHTLDSAEAEFLSRWRPAGIILFRRNIDTPSQVRELVASARTASGCKGDTLMLIDQEGGRVQRLAEPHWRHFPPARVFGNLYRRDPTKAVQAARLCARAIAEDLHHLGINTSCAPVLDMPVTGAHSIIGDRAYGEEEGPVVALGQAVAEGLLAGGVLPVMKHIPGHGRAMADSHMALPVVRASREELRKTDFRPFRALRHLPIAMTAHVVFSAYDSTAPVTISRSATEEIIRGEIGFDGLLMSDDLSMKALTGSFEERTEGALKAGCDIALHCNGEMSEMIAVARSAPVLEDKPLARFEAALAHLRAPEPFDRQVAEIARAEGLTMTRTDARI